MPDPDLEISGGGGGGGGGSPGPSPGSATGLVRSKTRSGWKDLRVFADVVAYQ